MVRPPAIFEIYHGSLPRRLEGFARVYRHYSPRWKPNCHLASPRRYAQSSYSLAPFLLSQRSDSVSVYIRATWTKRIWEDCLSVVGMLSTPVIARLTSNMSSTGRVGVSPQIQNTSNCNPHLSNIHIYHRDSPPLSPRILQPLPLRERPQSPRC